MVIQNTNLFEDSDDDLSLEDDLPSDDETVVEENRQKSNEDNPYNILTPSEIEDEAKKRRRVLFKDDNSPITFDEVHKVLDAHGMLSDAYIEKITGTKISENESSAIVNWIANIIIITIIIMFFVKLLRNHKMAGGSNHDHKFDRTINQWASIVFPLDNNKFNYLKKIPKLHNSLFDLMIDYLIKTGNYSLTPDFIVAVFDVRRYKNPTRILNLINSEEMCNGCHLDEKCQIKFLKSLRSFIRENS